MLLMFAATLRNDARISFLLRLLLLEMGAVSVKTIKDSMSRLLERENGDNKKDDERGEALRSILSFFSE